MLRALSDLKTVKSVIHRATCKHVSLPQGTCETVRGDEVTPTISFVLQFTIKINITCTFTPLVFTLFGRCDILVSSECNNFDTRDWMELAYCDHALTPKIFI